MPVTSARRFAEQAADVDVPDPNVFFREVGLQSQTLNSRVLLTDYQQPESHPFRIAIWDLLAQLSRVEGIDGSVELSIDQELFRVSFDKGWMQVLQGVVIWQDGADEARESLRRLGYSLEPLPLPMRESA